MTNRGTLIGIVAVGIMVTGCSGTSDGEQNGTDAPTVSAGFNTSVTFNMQQSSGFPWNYMRLNSEESSPCWGDTLSYMSEGAAVTVRDSQGATVALDRLPQGQIESVINIVTGNETAAKCTWGVTLQDVPASSFYTVAVDGGASIEVTEAELRDGLEIRLP